MIAAILALALAGAGQAGARPAPQPDMAAMLRQRGMSPAGIALVERDDPATRASVQQFLTRLRTEQAAMKAAAQAGDLGRLEAVMRTVDAVQAQFASARTTRTIGLLRALSPADRRILLQGMATGGAPAGR